MSFTSKNKGYLYRFVFSIFMVAFQLIVTINCPGKELGSADRHEAFKSKYAELKINADGLTSVFLLKYANSAIEAGMLTEALDVLDLIIDRKYSGLTDDQQAEVIVTEARVISLILSRRSKRIKRDLEKLIENHTLSDSWENIARRALEAIPRKESGHP